MATLKKPDLNDPKLREMLKQGMGHNYYGEPAWPNDLLYIFPVVILGSIACCVALAVLDPALVGEPADPFATPLEILPEWYLYPTFQILRIVPNKLLGIGAMTAIPLGLMLVPFIESINKFQNPCGDHGVPVWHPSYSLAGHWGYLPHPRISDLGPVLGFGLGYSTKTRIA